MTAGILIIFAIASRLIPHINNVAAISAVGILAGFLLPKKQAFAVPLTARLVTDVVIGFFAWQMMLAVYAAHLMGVLLGIWIKQSKKESSQWIKIASSGLFSAVLFFLITNFAFLYPNYPHTVSGVLLAYQNGLPFFRGTIVGDVAYTVGIFAVYSVAVKTAQLIIQVNLFKKV
jgi:hypothetical protein